MVELLVVIAVIAVLAGLLFIALEHVKEESRRTECASNLRQIALATFGYTADHDGFLPSQLEDGMPIRAVGGDGQNYYDFLMPYVQNARVWLCRSANLRPAGHLGYMSYHMNGFLITKEGLKTSSISRPSKTLLVTDAGEKHSWDKAFLRPDHDANYLYDLPINTHNGGGNVAMADGHLEWYHDSRWNADSFQLAP